jgi:hypothetical protein
VPAWGRLRWQTVQTVGGTTVGATVGETVTTKVKTTSVACQWPGSGLMLLDEAVAAQAQMRSRARVSAARRALPRRAVVSAGIGSAGWALSRGLRRPGAVGHVDFDAGTISIARNRVQAGAGTVVENEPKTLSSCRTLPLDEGLVAVLKRASVRYAQDRLALGAAHRDSGYVAVNEIGEPYTPDTLTRMWHKLAKAAGVRQIRLHDARHSCGTALHLRGVPLAVIAKWLGHADAATTARIYAHSQDDALRAAGQSLGGVVTSS